MRYKKFNDFPVPSRHVTNQTLPGREIVKIFLAWESLISDIPAGDGKMANFVLHTVGWKQCYNRGAFLIPLAEIPCQGGKNNIERPQAWYLSSKFSFFSVEVYHEIP